MIERSSSRPWYHTPLARWLAVALWMGLIFAFSAQSRLPSAPQPWLDFLFKKSAHFAVFATLAALLWRAFEWRPRAWIWAWLLTVIYAISDEWHQSFVAGRHPPAPGADPRRTCRCDPGGLPAAPRVAAGGG